MADTNDRTVRGKRMGTAFSPARWACTPISRTAVLVAVYLVTSYVAGGLPATLITALLACMLAGLWFAVPLGHRREQ